MMKQMKSKMAGCLVAGALQGVCINMDIASPASSETTMTSPSSTKSIPIFRLVNKQDRAGYTLI